MKIFICLLTCTFCLQGFAKSKTRIESVIENKWTLSVWAAEKTKSDDVKTLLARLNNINTFDLCKTLAEAIHKQQVKTIGHNNGTKIIAWCSTGCTRSNFKDLYDLGHILSDYIPKCTQAHAYVSEYKVWIREY